jgi:hypothetical protein
MADFAPTMESVLDMNSQAVKLLCQGRRREEQCCGDHLGAASSLLRSSFEKLVATMTTTTTTTTTVDTDQHMKECHHDASCEDSASCCCYCSTIEIFPVSSSCDAHGQQQQQPQLSTLAHSFSPNNAFEFYSKPFDVVMRKNKATNNSQSASTISEDQMIQVAAVVMYNLGLTNQMLAITTGKSSHLERAVVHYQRALQLLNQCCCDHDDINNIHNVVSTNVLLLAICNNCGYCRSYMLDAESTRNFQQYIHFILQTLPPCPPSSSSSSENNNEQQQPQQWHCGCCCSSSSRCWETECDYFYSSTVLLCGDDGTPFVVPTAPAA